MRLIWHWLFHDRVFRKWCSHCASQLQEDAIFLKKFIRELTK